MDIGDVVDIDVSESRNILEPQSVLLVQYLSVPLFLALHPWHHILQSELAQHFINDVMNEG